MIGALLCGLAYKACPKLPVAYVGEVFGTGILGGLASYPIAAFVMGNTKAALFTFVPSFLVSTAVGAAISVLVLSASSARMFSAHWKVLSVDRHY